VTPRSRGPSARPFTLLDAMILVAAAAVGLAALRWAGVWLIWEDRLATRVAISQVSLKLAVNWSCFGIPMTLAALAVRLRRPRASWRRLIRQPGMMAGLAVVPAWALAAGDAFLFQYDVRGQAWNPEEMLQYGLLFATALGGFAVAIAGMAQALIGRRPEPGWVDRLGRLVGVGWVLMSPLGWCAILL
jgi:hypothetical protein